MEKFVKEYPQIKEFRNSLFEVTHEIKNPIAVCKGYIDMLDTNNKKQVNKVEVKFKIVEILQNIMK